MHETRTEYIFVFIMFVVNPKCEKKHTKQSIHRQTELTRQVTYHERASAPAPSTTGIHPISHEEFAIKEDRDILNSCDKKNPRHTRFENNSRKGTLTLT